MTALTAPTAPTALTAARAKSRESTPTHIVKEFPNGPGMEWFSTLCWNQIKDPETLPWEDTAPEDRCPHCVNRLDRLTNPDNLAFAARIKTERSV